MDVQNVKFLSKLQDTEFQKKLLLVPYIGAFIMCAVYIWASFKTGGFVLKKVFLLSLSIAGINLIFIGFYLLCNQFTRQIDHANLVLFNVLDYIIHAIQFGLIGVAAYRLNKKYNYPSESDKTQA